MVLSGCSASAVDSAKNFNQAACTDMRNIYTDNGKVISDWPNQLATNADLEAGLKKLSDGFANDLSMTSGDLSSVVEQMTEVFKRARVAASNGDTGGVMDEITKLPDLATSFDAFCKAIDR